MKKQIIAAAIAAAVAAPAAMAGAPTVYGEINMSLDFNSDDIYLSEAQLDTDLNNDNDKVDFIKTLSGAEISSNSSRLGVKGSSDLGNGLKAIYKFETTINVDTGGFGGGRNAYVGLAGSFGAVLMGRHDTPMKMSKPTDLFNGDKEPMAGELGHSGGELRASNVLAYVSPSFNGIKLVAAGAAGETGDSSITDVVSVAAMYGSKKKGMYLAGAYNTFDASDASEIRLSAQYKAGSLLANVMYQTFDKTPNDGSNIQLNLGYEVGAALLKAKYSMVDYDAAGSSDGSAVWLGVDYALGKNTTGYVEYAMFDKNVSGNFDANGKPSDQSVLSVGLLHEF